MIGNLNPFLAFLAGVLTILSPCVLPLIPIVFASAAQTHKWGPVALASGLIVSFTAIGLTLSLLGVGADSEAVRITGALLILLAGLFLMLGQWQDRLSNALGPVVVWAQQQAARFERYGLLGQVAIGALLGLMWSPCIGPTLGAAIALAAERRNLFDAGLTMAAFSLGISVMLLVVAYGATFLFSKTTRFAALATKGKSLMGGFLVVVALLTITGGDHLLEGLLLAIFPEWLTELSSQY